VALDTTPPFGKVVLFELPTEATRLRKQLQEDYPGRDFTVYPGDCNTSIDTALRDLAPLASAPTFAFIDQYAAEIHWTTLVKLARFKRRSPYKVELWMLFAPSMLPRGLGQDDPDRVAEFASRITAMYGTPVWRAIHDARQDGRLTAADMRYELVNLMRWRLERLLRYTITHTVEMKNTRGVPLYEMIFATDNAAGNRIISHIYGLAAERQPRMREEALSKLRALQEEERGELTLFPPPGARGQAGSALPAPATRTPVPRPLRRRGSDGHECGCRRRHLVPEHTVELPPASLGCPPAPLLEEERHTGRGARIADVRHPCPVQRPASRSGLAPRNDPADPGQIQPVERSEERLTREKPHRGGDVPQMVDPLKLGCVLDGDPEPDIGRPVEPVGEPDEPV
jgi:three-Cys-motif partner protein